MLLRGVGGGRERGRGGAINAGCWTSEMRLMDEFIGRDVTLGRFDGDGEGGVCQGRPGIWRDGGKIGRVCVVSEESVRLE